MGRNGFQITLILMSLGCAILIALFFYREIAPEYLLYQDAYLDLEAFRATYTHAPPPPFTRGIKQIMLENVNRGPPTIDRCTSCHVALEIPYFSPTKIARDLNGNILVDATGIPIQEPNPDYIWGKLDERVVQLESEGKFAEAEQLAALRTVRFGDHTYDVTRALRAHPLIGRETRPFAYHPINEYGCTSCHNGNGLGLTSAKAHGPVFDAMYEAADMGPTPHFLERDRLNDPTFSRVFNGKPGHALLFQTTPIYVGSLIEAKCVQCHRPSALGSIGVPSDEQILAREQANELRTIRKGYEQDFEAVLSLLALAKELKKEGYAPTLADQERRGKNPALTEEERANIEARVLFLREAGEGGAEKVLERDLIGYLGTASLVSEFLEQGEKTKREPEDFLEMFLVEHREDDRATGALFTKHHLLTFEQALHRHIEESQTSYEDLWKDPGPISTIRGEINFLTQNYQRGAFLYISQGCYACHRIAGVARGGVGPELTFAGELHPWFLKESIVWPQADLKTSTMPNMRIDHEELEDLMTYLLAQKGRTPAVSETAYRMALQSWESGEKQPWEKPVPPKEMRSLSYGMTLFATQGCAGCHRLKGFEGNVGFAVEKENPSFGELLAEREWFARLFPEDIEGSTLVEIIEKNREEIDRRIVDNVRHGALLDTIEEKYPGTIASFYAPFKYAFRAKNQEESLIQKEWKARVHRVLLQFVQEYGLGRLIGPRPNWSGIYRSDQWLMEHFRKPTALIPRSIMPAFPFDDTKFYSLTLMLDTLGIRNRNALRQVWDHQGFAPAEAYETLCSQCHGPFLEGNGPVAEWIYPIPKNLRNADFLMELTRERAKKALLVGVPGTPMPPWGSVATDKPNDGIPVLKEREIDALVDWIFTTLPGGEATKRPPKWEYGPEDILRELEQEHEWPSVTSLLSPLDAQESPYSPQDLFVVRERRLPNGEREQEYFINNKYYTEKNIAAGERFFRANCAVCHGSEGEGQGPRAGVMEAAKPRMLTNLEWLDLRDDLRMLRSIKYGVTGTSMQPWGDQTTALQRLQLVMYIRSLSAQAKERQSMEDLLYQAYERPILLVEEYRSRLAEEERPIPHPLLNRLIASLRTEKVKTSRVGEQYLSLFPSDTEWAIFLAYLKLSVGKWSMQEGTLDQKRADSLLRTKQKEAVEKSLQEAIEKREEEKKILGWRRRTPALEEERRELSEELDLYRSLLDHFLRLDAWQKRSEEERTSILQIIQKEKNL